MELIPQFERLNSGEHNSRTLIVQVGTEYSGKKIKLGFVTPMGKVFISDELESTTGESIYNIPSELLDGKGILLAQIIINDKDSFIIKSPVYEFPVYASVDDMTCPPVNPEGIKSLAVLHELIMNKAEKIHSHDDLYYTEGETDVLLEGKSDKAHNHDDRYSLSEHNHDDRYINGSHNHDELYYTKEVINERLSDKSDAAHLHDERYYAKGEVDALFSAKCDAVHFHDDRYYSKGEVDAQLSGKSDILHEHDNRYCEKEHNHDDRYYDKEYVDNHLDSKSSLYHDHDERYYIREYVDAHLDSKSDVGHNHDDRYYSDSVMDDLLSRKSDAGHNHDGLYSGLSHSHDGVYSRATHDHNDEYYKKQEISSLLAKKSDADHTHDELYYTKETTDSRIEQTVNDSLEGFAEKGHTHVWSEIKERPGTTKVLPACVFTCDSLIKDGTLSTDPWLQQFETAPEMEYTPGETLNVSFRAKDSDKEYSANCRILKPEGDTYCYITFNNEYLTEDDLLSGNANVRTIKAIDSSKPAFVICVYDKYIVEIYTDGDYNGAELQLGREYPVKLGAEAIDIADKVEEGNNKPVSSGAVSEAIKSAGAVLSVNKKTGNVELTAADVNALSADTVIPTVPDNVSAFNNDAGYITAEDIEGLTPSGGGAVSSVNGKIGSVVLTAADVGALSSDTVIPEVPGNVSAFGNDAGYITAADIPKNVSQLSNDAGYITAADIPKNVSQLSNDAGYITAADIPGNVSAFNNDKAYVTSAELDKAFEEAGDGAFIVTGQFGIDSDGSYILNNVSSTVSDIKEKISEGKAVFISIDVGNDFLSAPLSLNSLITGSLVFDMVTNFMGDMSHLRAEGRKSGDTDIWTLTVEKIKDFRVDSKINTEGFNVSECSHTFSEISDAAARGDYVYMVTDICDENGNTIYKLTLPLSQLIPDAAAVFQVIIDAQQMLILVNANGTTTFSVSSLATAEQMEQIKQPFAVNASLDIETRSLGVVDKTYAEIYEAYENGNHVYMNLLAYRGSSPDISQNLILDLGLIYYPDLATFQAVVLMDVPTHINIAVFPNREPQLTYTALSAAETAAAYSIAENGQSDMLSSADDLDNLLINGVYVYTADNVPKNAPFMNDTVIEVIGADSTSSHKIQRAYRCDVSGYSAFRPLYNGSWGAWSVTEGSSI